MFSANPPEVSDGLSSTMTSKSSQVTAHRVKKWGILSAEQVLSTVSRWLPSAEETCNSPGILQCSHFAQKHFAVVAKQKWPLPSCRPPFSYCLQHCLQIICTPIAHSSRWSPCTSQAVTGIGDPILSLCVYSPLLSIYVTWLLSVLVSSSHMWQSIFFYLSNHHYVYSASGIALYHIPPWSIVSDLSLAGSLNTLLEVFSSRLVYFPQYHFLKDFLRRSRDRATDFRSINDLS